MVTLNECEHNETVTLFIQVLEVVETETPKRAYELRVRTPGSQSVRLIVWEQSSAATDDWITGDWYQIENTVVKQWESHTELNATSQTTLEPIPNTIEEVDTAEIDWEDSAAAATASSTPKTVTQNQLSERYESFRSLSTILNAIIESPTNEFSSTDTAQPLVQYYSVVQAMLGDDDYLPASVDGFGKQQLSRVPFEMRAYRRQYGNGEWVTEYHCTETVGLSEETRSAVADSALDADVSQLILPVVPETERPLPVILHTEAELSEALSLLSRFEARPEVPWDDTEAGKFPIEEVYDRFCTVENIRGVQISEFESDRSAETPSIESDTDTGTASENAPPDRCGFVWPQTECPDAQCSDDPFIASCCYRETWREYDRCIWHADTDVKKPVAELKQSRESEKNRLKNHLPRERLCGAILRDIQFTDEILTGVDFTGADLHGCDFTDSYLSYADFTGANLHEVNFTEATISKVTFRNADLQGSNFSGLSLYEVDFTGANLSNADLTDAKVEQAILTNVAIAQTEGIAVESIPVDPDLCINLSVDATVSDVVESLPENVLSESAVIFEIIGRKTANSISQTEIQQIVEQRVETARGYDRRTEIETPAETNTTERPDSGSSTGIDTKKTPPAVIAASSSKLGVEEIKRTVLELQSSGVMRNEALSYISQYVYDIEHDEGWHLMSGMNPTVGYHLAQEGITGPEELAATKPEMLRQIDGIPDDTVEMICEEMNCLNNQKAAAEETTSEAASADGTDQTDDSQEPQNPKLSDSNVALKLLRTVRNWFQ